jgi:hypothetical protein
VVSEEAARQQMGDMARFTGKEAKPLPPHLKALIEQAEQLKQQHKGM